MNRKKLVKLPDSELDIMLVLWDSPRGCKVSDIFKALKDTHPLSKAAIHTLLERLHGKGFIEINTVDAPTPYKMILPVVTEKEYRAEESDSLVDKLFRGNWRSLIASLVDSGRITEADIDEISRMIRDKEAEISRE